MLQQFAGEASKVAATQSQLSAAQPPKLLTAAQAASFLAAEKKTLPSIDALIKALAAESAKLPPNSTLVPWAKKVQGQ